MPVEQPSEAEPVAHLRFKALLLLIAAAVLLGGSILYLMYARGVFAEAQQLVLTTDDSEGVVPGMDMTFSGFPIGRVRRIELAPDATVRILVDVEKENAHWLRISSVFTFERGLVGGTKIRAFSGILDDPPLPDGAERMLLRGDTQAEIPRLVASIRDLVENLKTFTGENAPLSATIGNLRTLTDKFEQPGGVLGAVMGGDDAARQVTGLLSSTNSLLARADRLVAQADEQVFGKKGVMSEAQATVSQLNALLADTRGSLKKVDGVLKEAQGIAANTRKATTDLDQLRGEVEGSLRKVDRLITDLNRRWPFKRDPEVKLP